MQNFIGEIRMFGGNFAPQGWAFCAGQTIAIADNTPLFSLIGTTYGGDGVNTFNLPDLRGRLPVGEGQGPGLSSYVIGQTGGVETVTLAQGQLPAHNHVPNATSAPGTEGSPGPTVLIAVPTGGANPSLYATPVAGKPDPTIVSLASNAIAPDGGGNPHSNLMPTLCVNYIIALQGIFPARN